MMYRTEQREKQYGLSGGFEACHDLTDVNERRGRFNEIESFLGYGFRLGDFSAKAAYVYKSVFDDEESDTQQVEVELEYETPWVESEIHSARVHRGADGTVCVRRVRWLREVRNCCQNRRGDAPIPS